MKLEVGSIIPVYVSRECIDVSEPCKQDDCMVTHGVIDALYSQFGRGNYYVKSTTNGVKFTLEGYRYTCAFPPAAAKKIFAYDCAFKRTRDRQKTRASVKPFKTKIMVIECAKIPAPVSAERRKQLNKNQTRLYHERKAAGVPAYSRKSGGREMSI